MQRKFYVCVISKKLFFQSELTDMCLMFFYVIVCSLYMRRHENTTCPTLFANELNIKPKFLELAQ